MKTITKTFKTMLLAAVVFVMAQGCIPTIPGGNPTPVNLQGKIKSSKYYDSHFSDTFRVNYIYDSAGRIEQINLIYGTSLLLQRLSVSYQSNLIVVQNVQAPLNSISKQTFYIHPGTNWVDSTDIYYNTYLYGRITATRDNSNKLIRLSEDVFDTFGNRSFFSGLDTIVYNGNNITICTEPVNTFNTLVGGYVKSIYEYDLSKTIKPNTTCGKYMICNILYPLAIPYINTDIDVLGINMGIINENIMVKETNEPHYLFAPNQIDIVDHTYSLFNANEVGFTMKSSNSFTDYSYVYNAYY